MKIAMRRFILDLMRRFTLHRMFKIKSTGRLLVLWLERCELRTLTITMALLTAGFFGCKKSTSVAPPTSGAQTGASSAAAPASAAGPDRAAAKAAKVAGMKLYKEKNYPAAAEKFRAAISADVGFILAHYNLACVAALTGDKQTARAQLEYLSKSPDPHAHAKLAQAAGDWTPAWWYSTALARS